MRQILTPVVLLAAALTACSSGDKPEPQGVGPSVISTARPTTAAQAEAATKAGDLSPQEGSVVENKFVVYPNKLRVTFKAAEVMPRKLGAETKASETLIRVTFTAVYNGPQAIPFSSGLPFRVLHGANRFEAGQDAGYADSNPPLTSENPTQLAHGVPATFFYSYNVPTADLGTIAVTLDMYPGELSPITFTEVQKVLKR